MLADHPIRATIPAADLDRAKKFYSEILGFPVVREDPEGITYRSGTTEFDVYPTRTSGGAAHTLAAWEVPDLEKEMNELRERGVDFEEYDLPDLKTENGVATMGPLKGAWFKDSEGNVLAIVQWIEGKP